VGGEKGIPVFFCFEFLGEAEERVFGLLLPKLTGLFREGLDVELLEVGLPPGRFDLAFGRLGNEIDGLR